MSHQQSLFETEPSPWELDDAAEQLVATVVIAGGPTGEFDYLVPPGLTPPDHPERRIEPGRRVRVPLGRGNRSVVAYCVAVSTRPAGGRKLKSVASVLDRQPILSPPLLRLTRWMADYYLCSWGQVLEAVVPAGVRFQAGTREVTLLTLPPEHAAGINQLELPAKQAEALRILASSARPLSPKELAARAHCTIGPISALRKKGFLAESIERISTERDTTVPTTRQAPHELNTDQSRALAALRDALHAGEHRT